MMTQPTVKSRMFLLVYDTVVGVWNVSCGSNLLERGSGVFHFHHPIRFGSVLCIHTFRTNLKNSPESFLFIPLSSEIL